MIEIRLKTDKVKLMKSNWYGNIATKIEPVSSKYTTLFNLCIDIPGICFNDNSSWNELWVLDDDTIFIDYGAISILVDPNLYYIEIDEKEECCRLYMTATIKRKDN